MLKQLKLAGCELPENNFVCAPCDTLDRAGGYKPGMGAIVLCAGHIYSKDHQEHTMMHEMIHLFDECRFKLDWSNLRHHACTEVCRLAAHESVLADLHLPDSREQPERGLQILARDATR